LSVLCGVDVSSFDDISIAYDRTIDWDARLQRELPFILKKISDDIKLHILDLACGSGRHSVALAAKGHKILGIDSSMAMIDAARTLAQKKGVNVEFDVTSMEDFGDSRDKFDLVICLGNSLALLPSFNVLLKVVRKISIALRKDGIFILQVLNFKEIETSGFSVFPSKRGKTSSGKDVVFSRFFDHSDSKDTTTLVLSSLVKTDSRWDPIVSTQEVLRLDKSRLHQMLKEGRFSNIEYYGDYKENPFLDLDSRSLVIRARK
jgi:SAM-dependent methyltransferase